MQVRLFSLCVTPSKRIPKKFCFVSSVLCKVQWKSFHGFYLELFLFQALQAESGTHLRNSYRAVCTQKSSTSFYFCTRVPLNFKYACALCLIKKSVQYLTLPKLDQHYTECSWESADREAATNSERC